MTRLELRYVDADIMSMTDLGSLQPHEYDNIVLVSSDWLQTGDDSDARTLVAYLCLKRLFAGHARRPKVLLELLDDGNVGLLGADHDDVLLTPLILVGAYCTLVSLAFNYEWAPRAERLKAESDRPFFLAVGFLRPHVPWYVPRKWFDLHPLESIETPPYLPGDQDDVPEISRRAHAVPMMPSLSC